MMKHFNFSLNRILVFEFTTTADLVDMTMVLARLGEETGIRCIIRDAFDNLISNIKYNTGAINLNLSSAAGKKKIQLRISNPNTVTNFNMFISGGNNIPVKGVVLDEFRKFSGLKSLTVGGENDFYYLPESLSELEYVAIYGMNRISSIPNSYRNLLQLFITGLNTISELPPTMAVLQQLEIAGSNTIQEIPDTLVSLQYVRLLGNNQILSLPETLTSLISITVNGLNEIDAVPSYPAVEYIDIRGLNRITTIGICPQLKSLQIHGLNKIQFLPDLAMMPLLAGVNIGGSSVIEYDISNLPPNIIELNLTSGSNSVTYGESRNWYDNIGTFRIYNKAAAWMPSVMVDRLLIDFQTVSVWSQGAVVDLRYNHPRTPASDYAVSQLIAKGVTVLTY